MQSLQVNILDVFHSIKHLPAEEKVRIMEHLLGVAQPPPSMPSSFIPQLPLSPPECVCEVMEDDDKTVKEEEIEIVETPIVPPVIVAVPIPVEPPVLEAVPAKPKRELNWWVKGYSYVIQRMKAMNPNHPAFKENYFNMDVAILLREKGYLSETSMPTDDQIQEAFQARHTDPDTIQRCLQARAEKRAARHKKVVLYPKAKPVEPLLKQRDAVLKDAYASYPNLANANEATLLDTLNSKEDPWFETLLDLTREVNQLTRENTHATWMHWPRGSWASVCETNLLGPFASHEEAITHIRTIPRSCFGALSWQVVE